MAEFETSSESNERTQEYLSPIDVEIGLGANLRWALAIFENWSSNFEEVLQWFKDEIINSIDIESIHDVDTFWHYLYLPWENNYAIDIIKLLSGTVDFLEEWISLEDIASRYIEHVTLYRENTLQLEVIHDSIEEALENNDDEFWENIGAEDVIVSWPLEGLTLVEWILRFRKLLAETESLSVSLNLFPGESDINLHWSNERLFTMQEVYLLLTMWIWEEKEELVEVVPKSKEEIDRLIKWVVSRKNIEEIFDFMRYVHREIDDNNSQTGNVEENYTYFVDRLNELVFSKVSKEVTEPRFWEPSPHFNNPQILLDYASLVSWRTWWYDQALRNWEMDSRYRRPDMATRALSLAMTIRTREWEEQTEQPSMNDLMIPHLDIQDEALKWRTPEIIVRDFSEYIQSNVVFTNTDGTQSTPSEEKFNEIMRDLEISDFLGRISNSDWSRYESLWIEDKITLWVIVRILNNLSQNETRDVMGFPEDQVLWEWETAEYLSWPPAMTRITSPGGTHMDEHSFFSLFWTASQESIEHIWSELDRNFDDTWSEVWENTAILSDENHNGSWHDEADQLRAEKFWLSWDTSSLEYQIFSLYNNIQWNGNPWEVSDRNRDHLMTAWYMLAMVAGSMVLWWGIIFAASMAARAASITFAPWLITQGTIYGLSGSTMWYMLDAWLWDTRWFYSPTEAVTSVGSDFLLWWVTWAFWWVVANRFWNPWAKFFSRENVPNQAIFAWDITANGILPEVARLALMDKIWTDSEIFTPPLSESINEEQKSFLRPFLSDEHIEQYLSTPLPEDFELQNYRSIIQVFDLAWFSAVDIPLEVDAWFLRAYFIWKILNPWEHLTMQDIWQSEWEFLNGSDEEYEDITWIRDTSIKVIELWSQRQESRFREII